jgi:hypothetical protein
VNSLRISILSLALAAAAVPASAQYAAPNMGRSNENPSEGAVGEKYNIQVNGSLWNPTIFGVISSSQFGIAGSQISFENDLGFEQRQLKTFGVELKAGKRNKFYGEYIPLSYTSDTTFNREIVFNGQKFNVNVPVQATYDWKVWRVGYEIDPLVMSHGFIGLLFEARMTDFGASLKSPGTEEFTRANGPLPALGLIARAYPIKNLSITGQVSGFKVPDVSKDYQGSYADWNIYGTFNVNRFVGVQGGWRRVTTNVVIKKDSGNTMFKGIWFGGVVRY